MKQWLYGWNRRVLHMMPSPPGPSRSWCLRELARASVNGASVRHHDSLPACMSEALMRLLSEERVRAFHQCEKRNDTIERYICMIITISCVIISLHHVVCVEKTVWAR